MTINQKVDELIKKLDQAIKSQVSYNADTYRLITKHYNELKEMQEAHRSDLEKKINKNSKDIQDVYKILREIQDKDKTDLEARIERRVDSKKDGKYHYYAYKSNIQYGKKVDKYFVVNWSTNEAYKKKGDVEVEITDPRDKENLKYQIFQDFNKEQGPTRFVESDDPENDVISPYFYLKFKKDDMSNDDWGVQYDYYVTLYSWGHSKKPLKEWFVVDWKNKRVWDEEHEFDKTNAAHVMNSINAKRDEWIKVDNPARYLINYAWFLEDHFDYYAFKLSWRCSPKPLYGWIAIDWKNKRVYQHSKDESRRHGWLKKEDAEQVMRSVGKPDINMWIRVDRPEAYLKEWDVVYAPYIYYESIEYPGNYFILDNSINETYFFCTRDDGTIQFGKSWFNKENHNYREISLEDVKNYYELKKRLREEYKKNHIHCDIFLEETNASCEDEINLKKDGYKFYKDLSLPSPDLHQVSGRVYALDVENDVSYEFDYLNDGTTYFAKAFLKSEDLKGSQFKEVMPCEIEKYEELDSYLPLYAEDEDKITSKDLELLWRDHGFAAFYDEAKYYAKFLEQYDVSDKSADDWKRYNEHNKWADSATDDKTIWSRLFSAIAFFNIDKVATQIARANNDATTNEYLITSADVENPYSASEWNKCLYNCLKETVEDFIEHGEADKNDTYKNYQRGRIHLDSILYHYADENEDGDYPIIKLYWTDEESSAGDNW